MEPYIEEAFSHDRFSSEHSLASPTTYVKLADVTALLQLLPQFIYGGILHMPTPAWPPPCYVPSPWHGVRAVGTPPPGWHHKLPVTHASEEASNAEHAFPLEPDQEPVSEFVQVEHFSFASEIGEEVTSPPPPSEDSSSRCELPQFLPALTRFDPSLLEFAEDLLDTTQFATAGDVAATSDHATNSLLGNTPVAEISQGAAEPLVAVISDSSVAVLTIPKVAAKRFWKSRATPIAANTSSHTTIAATLDDTADTGPLDAPLSQGVAANLEHNASVDPVPQRHGACRTKEASQVPSPRTPCANGWEEREVPQVHTLEQFSEIPQVPSVVDQFFWDASKGAAAHRDATDPQAGDPQPRASDVCLDTDVRRLSKLQALSFIQHNDLRDVYAQYAKLQERPLKSFSPEQATTKFLRAFIGDFMQGQYKEI